jgi:hypothetical protein
MGPVVVVVMHPLVELGPGVVDRREHLAGQELGPHRLMPPLDVARRRRRPRRRQKMPDRVLPTDPVKQHLTGAGREPAGEHLAVIGQDLLGQPEAAHRQPRASQVGRAVARATTNAETTNLE